MKSNIEAVYDSSLARNNFDILRFLFAAIVFFVHSYDLSGLEGLSILNSTLSSEASVKSFFVLSGFLIFMSYENSSSISSYFSKRIRRIYPAYLFVILASVMLGSVFTMLTANEYWSYNTLNFFLANLTFLNFLEPELPGLFTNNLHHAVNGALWTLKIEVMFYIVVPLIAFCFNCFSRLSVMVLLFISSVIYSYVLFAMAQSHEGSAFVELQRQLPGQLTFFIVGAAGYYYFETFKKYALYLVPISVLAFLLKAHLPWIILEPLALGILVIYFATIFPYLGNFGKCGDFSYGIYILHFPILQLLIAHHLFEDSPVLFITVAGALVIILSILLWHFIEKPFLSKSSHYVAKHGS
jgi:peptidoglycan/LPS O-acetylase OafA/YrhL